MGRSKKTEKRAVLWQWVSTFRLANLPGKIRELGHRMLGWWLGNGVPLKLNLSTALVVGMVDWIYKVHDPYDYIYLILTEVYFHSTN